MKTKRQMHLIGYVLVPTGHHQGTWRHPFTDNRWLHREYFEDLARVLERGLFDMFFMPDIQALRRLNGSFRSTVQSGGQSSIQLDPMQVLASVASATRRIGLGVTASTPYTSPYALARAMASLDHLSGGRACWNIVTSGGKEQAANYGIDAAISREERYDQADEFVEACDALWRSWDRDALILDKKSGLFADPDLINEAGFSGQYFRSAGPLTVPRSPQGRPVLLQAGSSSRGRRFATRWADAIFTLQNSRKDMIDFRSAVRRSVSESGRDPDTCKVFPAVQVVLGETDQIAQERAEFANELINPNEALERISAHLGIDLTKHDLDEPLPQLEEIAGTQGIYDVLIQAQESGARTLRDLAKGYGASEQTPQVIGSPATVADQLEDYFVSGGADGFALTAVHLPGSFEEFCRAVVPELQRRGLFRRQYEGNTLRDHLQLSRPY